MVLLLDIRPPLAARQSCKPLFELSKGMEGIGADPGWALTGPSPGIPLQSVVAERLGAHFGERLLPRHHSARVGYQVGAVELLAGQWPVKNLVTLGLNPPHVRRKLGMRRSHQVPH